MTAVAGDEQGLAELLVVDERAAVAAHRGMKLVPRGVLGVAVEQIAGNQAGLAYAIQKLVAALIVRTAGEADEAGGGGQQNGEEQSAKHLQSIRLCEGRVHVTGGHLVAATGAAAARSAAAKA